MTFGPDPSYSGPDPVSGTGVVLPGGGQPPAAAPTTKYARQAIGVPVDVMPQGDPTAIPGQAFSPGLRQGHIAGAEYDANGQRIPLPDMFTADNTQAHTTPQGAPEYYVDGDQYLPLRDPSAIPGLQMELVGLGYISPKDIRYGTWDQNSADAYSLVLAYANRTGKTASDALDFLVAKDKERGQFGQHKAAGTPTLTLTNPIDTQAAFRTAAESLVGHDLPKSEANQFSDWYQGKEREAYNATVGGNTATAPPTVGNAAENYVNTHDANQAIAYGAASRMLEFQNLLGTVGSR